MNEIILEALKNRIEVKINMLDDKIIYSISGFYKSGDCALSENEDGSLTATTRYSREDIIENFEDLAELNYSWWKSSRERADCWNSPDIQWVGVLEKFGFISSRVETVKIYKSLV